MNATDVVIVGGGLAGLAAAVRLSSRGVRVALVERRQHLGGRTYSFVDETTGDVVDNGQHLLMGCYRETLAYLDTIGSRGLATLQPRLRIPFADVRTGSRSVLHAAPLPAPLHVFAGLLRFGALTLRDRLRLTRVGTELLWTAPWKEVALTHMTVDEWLTGLGQSPDARAYLWDVIAIGSLNDHPGTVSALPFFRVLRTAFFGARSNASLLVPNTGLSHLLVDPARAFIERNGGRVLLSSAVDAIRYASRTVTGVSLQSGESIGARSVILAVPHYAAAGLLPDKDDARSAGELESSPIVTINLWFDRPVLDEPFIALLNGHIQWAFNRSAMTGSGAGRQYLSCLISGARFHVEREKQELVAQAVEDLQAVCPAAKTAQLVHSLVVKEVRATFAPRPGSEALRPATASSISNLFLAGDWTRTGFPATIEGAVLSGHRAADGAFRALQN